MVQAFSRAEPSFAAPSLGWGAAHLPSLGRKQTQVLTSHPRPLGPGGVQCSERLATAGGGTVLLVSEPSPEQCFRTHGCRLLTSVRSRAQGRERPAGQHAGAPAGLVAPSVHGKPWSAWVALRWPAGLWAGGRSLMSEIGPQAPRGWTLVKCPCPRMLCPGTMRFPVSQPPNGAQDAAASWGRGGCWSPGSLWAGRGLGISLSPPWSCLEQWGALPLGGCPGPSPGPAGVLRGCASLWDFVSAWGRVREPQAASSSRPASRVGVRSSFLPPRLPCTPSCAACDVCSQTHRAWAAAGA